MRLLITIFFLFSFSIPLAAGPKEDVQVTISSQLQAFIDSDISKAFTYASPSIRSMFKTPENFGRMVKRGYPMVWRPEKVTFLEHKKSDQGRSQDVQIIDQEGATHYLRYYLSDTIYGWKISGVQFLNAADYAV